MTYEEICESRERVITITDPDDIRQLIDKFAAAAPDWRWPPLEDIEAIRVVKDGDVREYLWTRKDRRTGMWCISGRD